MPMDDRHAGVTSGGTIKPVRHEDEIVAAELELMTSSTRGDGARLQELLHEDFVEIGRSGRRWDRDGVTYRARTAGSESRHASVWDVGTEQVQMRSHQGTVVPE